MNLCSYNLLRLLLACLLLAGCAAPVSKKTAPLFKQAYQLEQARDEAPAAMTDAELSAASVKATPSASQVQLIQVPDFLKTRQVEFSPAGGAGAKAKSLELPAGEDVQISVEGMPVYDFVNLVFGQLLKLNYAVSPTVQNLKEKITLNMTEPMGAVAFFFFANELLERYQIEVRETSDTLYVDRAKRNARPTFSLDLYFGKQVPALSPAKRISQIVATDYVEPVAIATSLSRFLQGNNKVSYDIMNRPPGLVISGPVGEVQRAVRLISLLDRPFVAGKSVQLLPLEYVSATEFHASLLDILLGLGIPVAREKGQVGLTLIPLEQMGALLVISPKTEWVEAVTYWQRQLDTIDALGEEARLFVFQPQYRAAAELVEVIRELIGSAETDQPVSQVGATPQQSAVEKARSRRPVAAKRAAATPQREASAGLQTFGTANARVSLDEGRNAVILMTSPAAYKNLKRILTQLDTPPKQVITEVTIAEVTLTDQLELGLEWFLKEQGSKYNSDLMTLGGLGLGGSGFNAVFSKLNGDFQVMLNAFAKDDLINIISTPHIVVLDGQEATINVGTEVPVVTSETSASDIGDGVGSPTILRNVQYRNTGVVLKVKPVIHSDGMLTLDISQELSEAQTNNVSDISSPLILNRSLSTTLTLQSGETVVLGGLISENKSKTENKVPFLGDIPFLGRLFRVDSESVQKTELVVQITPYIINSPAELDRISRDFIRGRSALDMVE